MSLGHAIASGFKNYAQFRGKASRSEYWWWILFVSSVSVFLSVVDAGLERGNIVGWLSLVWSFGLQLPSLAIVVRRLRDAGYGWQSIFLSLIPFVGSVILIVRLCQPTVAPFTYFARAQAPQSA